MELEIVKLLLNYCRQDEQAETGEYEQLASSPLTPLLSPNGESLLLTAPTESERREAINRSETTSK